MKCCKFGHCLLQYVIRYDRKMFNSTGPGANVIRLFTSVSYES
jgi:hypothetical protein